MAIGNPFNYRGKVTLQRVRLDSQGYTSAGQYFGAGMPLYWFCTDEPHEGFPSNNMARGGYIDGHIRAQCRAHAKERIRAMPLLAECRFYS